MTDRQPILPVLIKVGDDFELHAGDLPMPTDNGQASQEALRKGIASVLRHAANVVERMRTSDEQLIHDFGEASAGPGSTP